MTINLLKTGCLLGASSVLLGSVFTGEAQAQLFDNFLFQDVTFDASSNAANISINLDNEGNIVLQRYTSNDGDLLIENALGSLVTSSTTFNASGVDGFSGLSVDLEAPTVSTSDIFNFSFFFEDVKINGLAETSDVLFTYQFDGNITSKLPSLSEGIQTPQTVIDLFGIAGNETPNSDFPLGLDVTRDDLNDGLVSNGDAGDPDENNGTLALDSTILFANPDIRKVNREAGIDKDTGVAFEPLNPDIGVDFFNGKGIEAEAVPEPTSILSLIGLGVVALGSGLKKKRTV